VLQNESVSHRVLCGKGVKSRSTREVVAAKRGFILPPPGCFAATRARRRLRPVDIVGRLPAGDADPVKVASGRTVVVFNIRGIRYRLVAAIHYNRQIVYTLRFMTHAEYSKNRWKDAL